MIYDVDTFNYEMLKDIEVLDTSKKRNVKKYLDVVCAFDIEATNIKEIEQAVMYIWQFQFNDTTIIGRTWEEYLTFLNRLIDFIPNDVYLVVYVHNLSYEFSFLKGVYKFTSDEVFATDKRKVLKCTMFNKIEYRCSYYLTNLSLDKFLKNMNVENKKLNYDYTKERYYDTKLSDEELAYCINDVKGLVQAIKVKLRIEEDTLQTIPLTSTGYTRRDMRQAMKQFNYIQLHDMLPNIEVYKLLREAFRGGDTLANRWHSGDILENISSVDIVSSYPSSLLMNKYPMTRFIKEDVNDFNELIEDKEKALLFRVRFNNIDVNDMLQGHTYLSIDKCRNIKGGTIANGRIIRADSLETTITDIDFNIINRRYVYDRMEILDLYSSNYRLLPSMFRKVVKKYYDIKTKLKGSEEGTDDYLFYMKNKERLNSCYGMTCEDIGKDNIVFIDGEFKEAELPLAELIEKNNKKAFLNYAWGVWCTAHSRMRLADGIDIVTKHGKQYTNFVYSDTDSIKYLNNISFKNYNDDIKELATIFNAYAKDNKGTYHYMGQFEDEGYTKPNRFKTMGAKKYVVEDKEKKLHITIAGVNKKYGGDELGKLENFKEGFIFTKSGGTEATYNDNINMFYKKGIRLIHITDNLYIKDGTYTLGITAEYKAILDGLIDIKYSDKNIYGLYKVKE